MKLEITESIFLGSFTESDLRQLQNLPTENTSLDPNLYSKKPNERTHFAIRKSNELIGSIGFSRSSGMVKSKYTIELIFWLFPPYQNQGILSKTLPRFIHDYVIKTYIKTIGFEIKSILCTVFTSNTPAIKLLEKTNFVKMATLKGYIKKNGIAYDEHVYQYVIQSTPFKREYQLFGTYSLRGIQESDTEACHLHRSHPTVLQFLASPLLSLEETRKSINDHATPESLRLAICHQDKLIGMIGLSLSGLVYEDHLAEIGYWIAQDHWGKGIMSLAIKVFLDQFVTNFVNKVLGYSIDRICAYAIESNVSSRRILEKNGFEHHGTTIDTFYKDGIHYNDTFYSRNL